MNPNVDPESGVENALRASARTQEAAGSECAHPRAQQAESCPTSLKMAGALASERVLRPGRDARPAGRSRLKTVLAIAGVVIRELYRRKDFYVLFVLTAVITLLMGSVKFFGDDKI